MSQIPPTVAPGPPSYAPPPSRGGGGKWILILVGVVAGVGVLICAGVLVLVIPAMKAGVRTARRGISEYQMTQIAGALQKYASANRGELPETAEGWEARVAKYMPPRQAGALGPFESPRNPGSGADYIYVPPGDLSKLGDPSSVIVLYENPEGMEDPGMVNVIYADWRAAQAPRGRLPK